MCVTHIGSCVPGTQYIFVIIIILSFKSKKYNLIFEVLFIFNVMNRHVKSVMDCTGRFAPEKNISMRKF